MMKVEVAKIKFLAISCCDEGEKEHENPKKENEKKEKKEGNKK